MSQKQKQPGTVNPQDRIIGAIDERLANLTKRHGTSQESNPNKKTGSKFGRKKRGRRNPKPTLHRRPGNAKNFREGIDMNDIIGAVRYILENHGSGLNNVISGYPNKQLLAEAAKKCMATCLSGWEDAGDSLVSENTNMVLSKNSWRISSDGSAELLNGFKFDYDWLYSIASNNIIEEAIEDTGPIIDKDSFSDTLSNASGLLRKLSDKEVKKYILNAAKNDENVDLIRLKEVLEDVGVNWKFAGAEIDNDKVNLLIKVRYSKDGTQEGVVEKKLSIEVKPSADVVDKTQNEIGENEVDLDFPMGKPEPEIGPETDEEEFEGGLDTGVDLK